MSATAIAYESPYEAMSNGKWIRDGKWDLTFISLSVVLVTVPYLTWLFLRDVLQIDSEASRQAVNLIIAIIIGGPHMYATFTRTALDQGFRHKYSGFVRSSIVIPLLRTTENPACAAPAVPIRTMAPRTRRVRLITRVSAQDRPRSATRGR